MSSTVGGNTGLQLRAQQAFKTWNAQPDNVVAAPDKFQAFAKDTAKQLGVSVEEFMKLLEPYAHAANTPLQMSPEQHKAIESAAAKYLGQSGAIAPSPPPPPPPAPAPKPPLPPKEKGWFDRMVSTVSDLGSKAVNLMEDVVSAPTDLLAKATKDIPILGSITAGVAAYQRTSAEVVGGLLKGAGGLVEGVATMIAHPIDTVKGLAVMASHIPMIPANPIRLAMAGYDIVVEGKPAMETLRKNLDPRETLADDAKFGKTVLNAFVEPYKDAIHDGKYGEAIGRGAFEIISLVATGGESAGAKIAIEGAETAAKVGRVAEVAAEAGKIERVAEVAGEAGKVERVAEAAELTGKGAKGVEAAEAAGKTEKVAGVAEESSRMKSFPPAVKESVQRSKAMIRDALGDHPVSAGGPATAKAQKELLENFKFSGLDEAAQAKELARLQQEAAQLGRPLAKELRTMEGKIAELSDFEHADEILEHLAQTNPKALKELYKASYEAFGVDAKAAEDFIHDYTHSSNKVNKPIFDDIGAAAKQVLRKDPLTAEEAANLSPRAKILKQMMDTREARQRYIGEVLGIEPHDGYRVFRVFRGSTNPESVERAALAWFKGDDKVAVTNRGISSTSLDREVAVDFSRGGPRSVTVDPKVVEYQEAVKAGKNPPMPLRDTPKDTYISYDMDVENRAVVFDKYTDGGFSVDGTLAQRSQREVLIGGPQDSFAADARRVQINYKGKAYMYEDKDALFKAMQENSGVAMENLEADMGRRAALAKAEAAAKKAAERAAKEVK